MSAAALIDLSRERAYLRDLGRAFVRDAYDLPDYATDDMQQRAARQYGDDVYAQCYDHYSED